MGPLILALALVQDPADLPPEKLDALLARLADESLAVREAATETLHKAVSRIFRDLEAGARSSDPETRKLCRRFLLELRGTSPPLRRDLDETLVTLETNGRSLRRVLEDLSSRFQIPVEWEKEKESGDRLGEEKLPDRRFADVPVARVLNQITEDAGYLWWADARKMYVRRGAPGGELRVHFLYVADLTTRQLDPPAPPLDFSDEADPDRVEPAEPRPVFEGEELAHQIAETVHKESWGEEPRAAPIFFSRGLLLFRTSSSVDREVRAFVAGLRRRLLRNVHARVEFFALRPSLLPESLPRELSEETSDSLRRAPAEGAARRIAAFRIALAQGRRTPLQQTEETLLLRPDDGGEARLVPTLLGTRLRLRPTISEDGKAVSVDAAYGVRTVAGSEKKKIGDREIQLPRIALAQGGGTLNAPAGRWIVVDDRTGFSGPLPDFSRLVVLARFDPEQP